MTSSETAPGNEKPWPDELLDTYALALGHVLHAWNMLHHHITRLFMAVCGVAQRETDDDKDARDLMLAVWNAIPNDRMQRHMLRQAAKAKYACDKHHKEASTETPVISQNERRILAEIIWVLDTADTLGRYRDDSAHVPMVLSLLGDAPVFEALDDIGHPIAEQLSGKNLLHEWELTHARIAAVSQHAFDLWTYVAGWGSKSHALPKRPEWPTRSQPSGHKASLAPSQKRMRKSRRPAPEE